MLIRVTIKCDGKITSSEEHEFPSPWRALADTIDGCGYLYHPKQVKVVGNLYYVTFSDGTMVEALKLG